MKSAFGALKAILSLAPVLHSPDFISLPYVLLAEVDDLEKNRNNAVVNLDSPDFKSKDYLILMARIRERENSNKLPDLKVCNGLVYRQTNFSLKKELQKQLARKVWITET